MNAKGFVKALEDGLTVFRGTEKQPIHPAMSRHPSGTYVYMDVPQGVFVTVDRIEAVTDHEILGWSGDAPVLTIKTEEWFA